MFIFFIQQLIIVKIKKIVKIPFIYLFFIILYILLIKGLNLKKKIPKNFLLAADNPRPRLFTKNTVQSNDEES